LQEAAKFGKVRVEHGFSVVVVSQNSSPPPNHARQAVCVICAMSASCLGGWTNPATVQQVYRRQRAAIRISRLIELAWGGFDFAVFAAGTPLFEPPERASSGCHDAEK
jgi:hypothetical protein